MNPEKSIEIKADAVKGILKSGNQNGKKENKKVAFAADVKSKPDDFERASVAEETQDITVVSKKKADPNIIRRFDTVASEFYQCHKRLQQKYGAKSQVIAVSVKLIMTLDDAKRLYKKNGDVAQFKASCQTCIDDAKDKFNTHRDKPLVKFFGDLWEAFKDIFKSKQDKEIKINRSSFFGSKKEDRVTKAGQELHNLYNSLEAILNSKVSKPGNDAPESDVGITNTGG